MLEISRRLLYYKRKEIQQAIVESAKNREVGIKFGEKGFGKRPDVLVYENDILESVKQGATSFHLSEERWTNPMALSTDLKKEELDELREGWDLVLDIDCPYWKYSKLTTHLFIRALKEHGITSVSCKFSGNKGFHIGVPFEAFPPEINNLPTRKWFPDGPKRIAMYLLDYIANNMITIKSGEINFDNVLKTTIEEIAIETGKTREELHVKKCKKCHKKIKAAKKEKYEFVCPKCSTRIVKNENPKIQICPKCSSIMEGFSHQSSFCSCGSDEYKEVFEPLMIVNVDTILISSRHMFRAPYSMHEKSGLVSVLIEPEKVMDFEKEYAKPENVKIQKFLQGGKKNEALRLLTEAFDYGKEYGPIIKDKKPVQRTYEEIGTAVPVELFPPCILRIMEGVEDGKKRSLFVLTNFLTSVGWEYDKVENALLEWNKKNKEPLKDALVSGQVRYHRQKKKKVLPPNCRAYYQDFQVCFPDALCDRIKNPVQYSKRKSFHLNKPKRARLSEEQKEMRRKFREDLKKRKQTDKKDSK
jgi:ribosomal protein L37AE/L43A